MEANVKNVTHGTAAVQTQDKLLYLVRIYEQNPMSSGQEEGSHHPTGRKNVWISSSDITDNAIRGRLCVGESVGHQGH